MDNRPLYDIIALTLMNKWDVHMDLVSRPVIFNEGTQKKFLHFAAHLSLFSLRLFIYRKDCPRTVQYMYKVIYIDENATLFIISHPAL